jgi:hypothetical protein
MNNSMDYIRYSYPDEYYNIIANPKLVNSTHNPVFRQLYDNNRNYPWLLFDIGYRMANTYLLEWLWLEYQNHSDIREIIPEIFQKACIDNKINIITLIVLWNYPIKISLIMKMFHNSCINNRLSVAKCLLFNWPVICKQTNISDIFTKICKNKNCHMIVWFLQTFDVSKKELLVSLEYIIRKWKGDNQWDIIKKLIDRLPKLSYQDFFPRAIFMNCSSGNLIIAQELYNLWPLFDYNYTFAVACVNGHLHIAQWIYDIYPDLNVHDYKFKNNVPQNLVKEQIFTLSCFKSHLPVIKWLVSVWSKIDIHANNSIIFENSHDETLLRWLSAYSLNTRIGLYYENRMRNIKKFYIRDMLIYTTEYGVMKYYKGIITLGLKDFLGRFRRRQKEISF